jgi:hypothetical protein
MLRRTIATCVLAMVLTGCVSIKPDDLVGIPNFAREETKNKDTKALGEFATKYQQFKSVAKDAKAEETDLSAFPAVNALVRTRVAQTVVDAVYSARAGETKDGASPWSRLSGNLSDEDFKKFHSALSKARQSLLNDAATKGASKTFDKMLVQYYIDYANGEFIDRTGADIGGFSVDGGLSNETITAIAAVFWEAVFDYWGDMPVFKDGGKYFTDKNKEPTAIAEGYATVEDLVVAPAQGIDKKRAKIIRGASNFAGKQASAQVAAAFGFIGKINVGFVLMPGFSVGDSKTLMELVKVSAERATRRGTEIAVYKAFKNQQTKMGQDANRIVAAQK